MVCLDSINIIIITIKGFYVFIKFHKKLLFKKLYYSFYTFKNDSNGYSFNVWNENIYCLLRK